MRVLKQRVELTNLYHHWMEEFNNLRWNMLFEGKTFDLSKKE
jgi:hypothetical protein